MKYLVVIIISLCIDQMYNIPIIFLMSKKKHRDGAIIFGWYATWTKSGKRYISLFSW